MLTALASTNLIPFPIFILCKILFLSLFKAELRTKDIQAYIKSNIEYFRVKPGVEINLTYCQLVCYTNYLKELILVTISFFI